jgi:hypothetical protein
MEVINGVIKIEAVNVAADANHEGGGGNDAGNLSSKKPSLWGPGYPTGRTCRGEFIPT